MVARHLAIHHHDDTNSVRCAANHNHREEQEQNQVQAPSQEGDDIEAGNDHNLETGSGDRDSNDNLDHARPVVIPGNRSKCS
jgi:hypothetical protein